MRDAMRVAYVTMLFPAKVETFAGTDLRELRDAGTELSVHCLRRVPEDRARLLQAWDLRALRVSYNSVIASLRGLRSALRQPALFLDAIGWIVRHNWRRPDHLARSLLLLPRCIDIVTTLRNERPDVVHLFWGHYPAIVGYLVRRSGLRTCVSMFLGAYDLEWRYGGSRPAAVRADVVWTHARYNLAVLEALGVPRDRIQLAYRGIDLRRWPPPAAPKTPRRIATAGRLTATKGMGDVLHVFRRVLTRWPDASLVIMGPGPERARLEALARTLGIDHAVRFLGFVDHGTVRDELARAELFLFMSSDRTERLPNVVKEAMASECLCVVGKSAGIDELVIDGHNGVVVEAGDIETAASRIVEVLADPELARRMIASASAHVRARFDAARTMAAYRARWHQLTDQPLESRTDPRDGRSAQATTPRWGDHSVGGHESNPGVDWRAR